MNVSLLLSIEERIAELEQKVQAVSLLLENATTRVESLCSQAEAAAMRAELAGSQAELHAAEAEREKVEAEAASTVAIVAATIATEEEEGEDAERPDETEMVDVEGPGDRPETEEAEPGVPAEPITIHLDQPAERKPAEHRTTHFRRGR